MARRMGDKSRVVKFLSLKKRRGLLLLPEYNALLREFGGKRAVATHLRWLERSGKIQPHGKRRLAQLEKEGF